MIKDVKIGEINTSVPEEGYYITLYWEFNYQDDGYIEKLEPISSDKKHILLELLNLLEEMSNPNNEDYKLIDNYDKYFECLNSEEYKEEEFETISNLELCRPMDNDCEEYGRLDDFAVVYHDGKVLNSYSVTLDRD